MNDKGYATNEEVEFLNKEQKQVKQKIMEDCINGLFGNLEENHDLFDLQSVLDLIASVLVMFNRDVLIHIFYTAKLVQERNEIMRNLFDKITYEVNKKIKEGLQ